MNGWKFILKILFPACAGVILEKGIENVGTMSFPRVCGGDPMPSRHDYTDYNFSPRVRG